MWLWSSVHIKPVERLKEQSAISSGACQNVCNYLWMQRSPTLYLPNQITQSIKLRVVCESLPSGSSVTRHGQFPPLSVKLLTDASQRSTRVPSSGSFQTTENDCCIFFFFLLMHQLWALMTKWHLTFTMNKCLCNSPHMGKKSGGIICNGCEAEKNTN